MASLPNSIFGDETPREEMRHALGLEVELELSKRRVENLTDEG